MLHETTMGPLISVAQQKRVLDYIDIGRNEGAVLACGGEVLQPPGFFVEPTVFAHVHNDMRIAREEIFGPVAVLIPFESEDEAIALANDNAYSLAAAVWQKVSGARTGLRNACVRVQCGLIRMATRTRAYRGAVAAEIPASGAILDVRRSTTTRRRARYGSASTDDGFRR